MKTLGLLVLFLFAAIGAITVIDLVTMRGDSTLIGGTPVLSEGDNPTIMLTGRVVRFPPLLQQDRRRAAVLDEDYFFCAPETKQVIRLPRGYQTDFASIPWVARLLVDRFGSSLEPAAIHDWLYSVGGRETNADRDAKRADADRIFLDALEDNGVGLATRTIMYLAVRLFGGDAYGRESEWEGRLRDPLTGESLDPAPARPLVGSVAELNCAEFDNEQMLILVGCYSTNESWLFPADGPQRGRCGPGDGLIVPRT
jgi:hypothetical protein